MAIAGKGGKLSIGAEKVSSIESWSLDLGLDTLEITALGDDWKTFISGLKEWSASAEGSFLIHTDTNGQTALQNAYLNGTEVNLRLYLNATNYYSGNAFISGLSVEDPVDDKISVSFEFQGSGELTYN